MFNTSTPDNLYPGLAFIGPIPMIERKRTIKDKSYTCFVPNWKAMSDACKARVKAEIDQIEDSCYDRSKL